ncbi:MAG: hypothetical protein ACE5KX_02105, partial [Acidimicrobiia bacterium]
MGQDQGPAGRPRALSTGRVAQVVPDLPAFTVDDGFAYLAPDDLGVEVGRMVRVPLGGRRVRGYVVGLRAGPTTGLKEIAAVSGDLPVFSPRLLEVLRWCALYYVAPLATVLGKAAPPNLPRRVQDVALPEVARGAGGPLPEVSSAAASSRRPRTHYLLGAGPWLDAIGDMAAPVLAADRSVVAVAPTLRETLDLAAGLQRRFGARVLIGSSGLDDAVATDAWVRAASRPGHLLVGTREVALWPVAALALAFAVEEGRRGMKDRATPTTHVREVLWQRAGVERFGLVFLGGVPTTEVLYRGPGLARLPGRRRTWA